MYVSTCTFVWIDAKIKWNKIFKKIYKFYSLIKKNDVYKKLKNRPEEKILTHISHSIFYVYFIVLKKKLKKKNIYI